MRRAAFFVASCSADGMSTFRIAAEQRASSCLVQMACCTSPTIREFDVLTLGGLRDPRAGLASSISSAATSCG
jgi:hypothetical protein